MLLNTPSTTNIDNENDLQPDTFLISDAIRKENTSQRQKMAWRDILLISHSKASAERVTRRYLEDINSASCLIHLDKALDQLLDGIKDVEKIFSNYATTNPSGKRVWNRGSFARYINARLPENPAATTCVPLLWCTFSIGAYFPFSAPSNEREIDVKAFRRAFAFIVLRGYELLGAKSNGQPFSTITEKFYTDKVPRLTRIVYRSLSTPWRQSGTQSQDPQESLQLQDIKDTIAFTQPIIKANMHHGRATVADGEFEAAAYRLLLADNKRSTVRGSSIAPSFIFSFFQLWATIFTLTTAPQAPRAEGKCPLLISTTNILSFLNVAHFLSGKLPNYRFHHNESLFQLDLQASTLVANLATTPELSVEELHKVIAAQDWFHVMLIRGEDLKVEGKSSSRLIVAFTSPPEKEMWRPERKRSMQYIWRTSVAQLEPDLTVADNGGMSASVMGEVLALRSHGGAGKEDTSMKVDLAGKIVNVTGLGTGLADNAESKNAVGSSEATSTLVMRLTNLKCYRMPGMSSKITRSG
ncbi:uncharacterized protein ACLA_055630 [Aspergillus clavatus NRRL 1]|uniref:Uncharacterized protein n=1 Tax=Aspergillus clavatus (strain ATCC 1007 / CBS 513.65 / DSM 816 / NCTC 3887 / NRRL 1 / QM 1276 / 107) TaxID=344612 RepID=A1C9J1_ASPCL|nr:uncharacterized protein ACLA_055630 [Aspergillus clavatus NRRL 1]EAW13515.1 hypothetical protein ACLA_055630 [Aspergillus clavatus NRRL 1]